MLPGYVPWSSLKLLLSLTYTLTSQYPVNIRVIPDLYHIMITLFQSLSLNLLVLGSLVAIILVHPTLTLHFPVLSQSICLYIYFRIALLLIPQNDSGI